jgi:hypothetical protein
MQRIVDVVALVIVVAVDLIVVVVVSAGAMVPREGTIICWTPSKQTFRQDLSSL